ncbi:MAG TPA: phosphoribosylaminoimidazolesuccinocarboxamide synthase [bacterium]|nr:phosphoribosylaminoimidazolesuccinocarboxamide synthase [bacterium]
MTTPIHQSNLPYLKLLFRGKVRDIYDLGDELLLVATDRLSAFDVVFPNPIPGKGEILTQVSLFWFGKMKGMIPNHISDRPVEEVFKTKEDVAAYAKRSMLVKKTKPLAIEAVMRGYLAGSGWNDYQKTGKVCGIALPPGLKESQKLPQPIFTPATKAPQGEHDENISFERACEIVGKETAERVRDVSLKIYTTGLEYAESKGLILADTKFEFGHLNGELILIDEILTPDSSRFWPKDQYQVGISPPSFDKQFVRDYLLKIGWNKKPPAPELPAEIVEKTAQKYQEALRRLTA